MPITTTIMKTWKLWLEQEFKQPYFQILWKFVQHEYQTQTCYPKKSQLFRAFTLCPPEKIKVVILGQDPYHQPNQAHGLAFSVPEGLKIPPSLQNIFLKLQTELDILPPIHGDLTAWAKQGVFLLNTILSVRQSAPLSHRNQGWEQFTEAVIKKINQLPQPIVFFLWGAKAQYYAQWLNNPQHLILKTSHPSPLSAHRGFLTEPMFQKAQKFFNQHRVSKIIWDLTDNKSNTS